MESGKEMFLRYSHGCRMYCEEKGMISAADMAALDSGDPSYEVLKRVFYVAIPSLEKISKQMGKDVFDINVLREFYSGEHNERKFREGQLICLSFPARIVESKEDHNGNQYLVDLEPVKGRFWSESKFGLKAGDWVVLHRADIVEKVPEDFAVSMAEKLRKLGLDKTYKFPKVAIKYLNKLSKTNIRRYNGNVKADQITPDEGKGEASPHPAGPKEASDKGPGEAYA